MRLLQEGREEHSYNGERCLTNYIKLLGEIIQNVLLTVINMLTVARLAEQLRTAITTLSLNSVMRGDED